jgi:hypothetical protein
MTRSVMALQHVQHGQRCVDSILTCIPQSQTKTLASHAEATAKRDRRVSLLRLPVVVRAVCSFLMFQVCTRQDGPQGKSASCCCQWTHRGAPPPLAAATNQLRKISCEKSKRMCLRVVELQSLCQCSMFTGKGVPLKGKAAELCCHSQVQCCRKYEPGLQQSPAGDKVDNLQMTCSLCLKRGLGQ